MGVSYDAGLSIGYTIDLDNIPKRYRKRRERQAHLEDRYDPKTGRKLAGQVEMVEQEAGDVWTFQDKDYEDVNDFLDTISLAVGALHGEYGDLNNDPVEEHVHRIELPIPEKQGDCTGVDFAWLTEQLEAVQEIGHKLNKLGFKIDKPTAAAHLAIC
jgi:hypothetical protein